MGRAEEGAEPNSPSRKPPRHDCPEGAAEEARRTGLRPCPWGWASGPTRPLPGLGDGRRASWAWQCDGRGRCREGRPARRPVAPSCDG